MHKNKKKMKRIMNYKFDAEHTFFTSDTHFSHANIIRYCVRPFKDVEQMNEAIIANWNSVIGSDDIVFHLRDFCLGNATEWTNVLNRLNGKIFLIMGNHDLKIIRQGFIQRFEHITMQMRIEIGKRRIHLCHYPFLCFEGCRKDVWQLFGHMHTRKNSRRKDANRLKYLYPTQYDVGVDNNDFTPVSFAKICTIIKSNHKLYSSSEI